VSVAERERGCAKRAPHTLVQAFVRESSFADPLASGSCGYSLRVTSCSVRSRS